MTGGRAGICVERALSEVIGFVLILGLIVVVFSLYLTYGIPAQGRDDEITHMNDVKDQFVVYKIGLDSLFNNNKIDTTVSNSFTLGTGGSFMQGSVSIIPLLSPVRSSGTIAINQRTTVPEMLTLSSYSMVLDPNVHTSAPLALGSSAMINTTPQHLFINISNIQSNDLQGPTPTYYGLQVNGTGWMATVNLTPRMTTSTSYAITTSSSTCLSGTQQTGTSGSGANTIYYCLNPASASLYSGTDISVSVFKNNGSTLQGLPVYKTISPGISYAVDIMDPTYGIQSVMQYPDTFLLSNTLYSYNTTNNDAHITGNGNVVYGYSEKSYAVPPITLGSLEYRGQNNYWISQNYYYQLGGVFITQVDGNTTYKLPPEITFSYANDTLPDKKIVIVNINALAFDPNNQGIVGGNSPVQIKTTLNGITTLPYMPVATGYGNTKSIRIGVNSTDAKAREMWNNYFTYTAAVAGIPNYQVNPVNSPNESYIIINGYDTTGTTYDINVIASNATYTTTIHGIGGTYL